MCQGREVLKWGGCNFGVCGLRECGSSEESLFSKCVCASVPYSNNIVNVIN